MRLHRTQQGRGLAGRQAYSKLVERHRKPVAHGLDVRFFARPAPEKSISAFPRV
jgi:hypothetical protein